jgi:hypothetical protein
MRVWKLWWVGYERGAVDFLSSLTVFIIVHLPNIQTLDEGICVHINSLFKLWPLSPQALTPFSAKRIILAENDHPSFLDKNFFSSSQLLSFQSPSSALCPPSSDCCPPPSVVHLPSSFFLRLTTLSVFCPQIPQLLLAPLKIILIDECQRYLSCVVTGAFK